MIDKLIVKLKSKKFSVCVIGLGYVGLPLISRFIKSKIKVYGIDNDKNRAFEWMMKAAILRLI